MLRITGDINFSDGYFDTGIGTGSRIRMGMNPFRHLKRDSDDYWIGNFECVCADTSDQQGLKARQFLITPETLQHVSHLNCYGVANNHVSQHGPEAFRRLIDYLGSKGVAYAGTREKRTHVLQHQGKQVSLTAFSLRPDNFTDAPAYWHLPELSDVQSELSRHADSDYRIVFVHWGNEFINYPYIDQKHVAHFLIDSGADLVVGMHPHVMQGSEQYKNGWIFYSLGNFVFNMPWEPAQYGLIVNVDLSKTQPAISFNYVRIGEDACPVITNDVPADYSMSRLNKLLGIQEENEKYYAHVRKCCKNYRRVNRRKILSNFMQMKPHDSWGIIMEFVRKSI